MIPTTLDVHLSMTLPILIPFVFFSHALNKVWRRHMLAKHGLDPHLVDELSREKNAHIHDAYIERYGHGRDRPAHTTFTGPMREAPSPPGCAIPSQTESANRSAEGDPSARSMATNLRCGHE